MSLFDVSPVNERRGLQALLVFRLFFPPEKCDRFTRETGLS